MNTKKKRSPWQVKSEEMLCSTPHLSVVREMFESTAGEVTFPWFTVRRKAAVVMVAETEQNKIVMIRQYRPSLRRVIWEFPAGQVDGVATATEIDETVRREVQEETGYEVFGTMQWLGHFYSSPGFTDEEQLVFRVRVKKGSHLPGDDAHRIYGVEEVGLSQLGNMVANGEILDAKTLATWALLNRK